MVSSGPQRLVALTAMALIGGFAWLLWPSPKPATTPRVNLDSVTVGLGPGIPSNYALGSACRIVQLHALDADPATADLARSLRDHLAARPGVERVDVVDPKIAPTADRPLPDLAIVIAAQRVDGASADSATEWLVHIGPPAGVPCGERVSSFSVAADVKVTIDDATASASAKAAQMFAALAPHLDSMIVCQRGIHGAPLALPPALQPKPTPCSDIAWPVGVSATLRHVGRGVGTAEDRFWQVQCADGANPLAAIEAALAAAGWQLRVDRWHLGDEVVTLAAQMHDALGVPSASALTGSEWRLDRPKYFVRQIRLATAAELAIACGAATDGIDDATRRWALWEHERLAPADKARLADHVVAHPPGDVPACIQAVDLLATLARRDDARAMLRRAMAVRDGVRVFEGSATPEDIREIDGSLDTAVREAWERHDGALGLPDQPR